MLKINILLDNLTNEQKDAIAAVLITQKYYKNQTIVNEGDPGSSFYIIKEVFLYKLSLKINSIFFKYRVQYQF